MIKLLQLDEIFEVKRSVRQEFTDMDKSAKEIAFVTRGLLNNGVVGYVKRVANIEPNLANTISISCDGSVMSSFLQPRKYYVSQRVCCLKPRLQLTEDQLLYYCTCLSSNKYKYNFCRHAGHSLRKLKIPHPDYLPAYVKNGIRKVRESFVKLLNAKMILDTSGWKIFALKDLFAIGGTRAITLGEIFAIGKGAYPYVTNQKTNNAVYGFFDCRTEKGNVLTIDSAVTGYCSYQSKDFATGGHVKKLQPKFTLTKELALFLTTILNKEQYRFNYGRKAYQERLANLCIKLPITLQGKPNWQFMEDYIRILIFDIKLSQLKVLEEF